MPKVQQEMPSAAEKLKMLEIDKIEKIMFKDFAFMRDVTA